MSDGYRVPDDAVAIIGMSGRFPGARDIDELWSNLCRGEEAITYFGRDELLTAGLPASLVDNPHYVRAGGLLGGVEEFDAGFFGFSPREADLLDPQQRLFLENAAAALERAGYGAGGIAGRIGVYAGAGMPGYLIENLLSRPDLIDQVGPFQALIATDKDFLATRVSYKLDLRGPSVSVQTACSTSLVAVALACQALVDGECDMALAGGVTVRLPQPAGYLYQPEGILSPDGHCRAFDSDAAGTVPGSGVGIVLLKPLGRALEDGDWIHAIVLGWAVNNDGASKVGYTAPSVEGQAAVIAEALAIGGVDQGTVGYVEAHGTGTRLGDPIEIAALNRAFGGGGGRRTCAIGSIKTNLGHLDNAAGVAGLIKTALAVEHGRIPPSLHFTRPNPEIDFAAGPFYVNTELAEWRSGRAPRRAGVSSFGIGGTNAHIVLEEPPPRPATEAGAAFVSLPVSARSAEALDRACADLARHLEERPGVALEDVAYTLQVGRRAFAQRRCVVAADREAAISGLRDPVRGGPSKAEGEPPPVAFLFPGQGAQHVGMARELRQASEVFRRELDACVEILEPSLGFDLRSLLCSEEPQPGPLAERLAATAVAQPALFTVEYALARLWMDLGVEPSLMLGHSIGEYVAACLAEVFSLEDALAVVAARGRLVQELPAGSMLAVLLPEEDLAGFLEAPLAVAAVNGPGLCTISGPGEAVAHLERRLAERGVATRRLRTSHAFHSPMMAPAATAFRRELEAVPLRAPRVPFVSNVSGSTIRAEEASDPEYWVRHLLEPVRFREGMATLLEDPRRLLLEVGPGDTLTTLARQAEGARGRVLLPSTPHPGEGRPVSEAFLVAAGGLWGSGVAVRWEGLHRGARRRRVPLPTYPFERSRHWVEPGLRRVPSRRSEGIHKRPEMADWFYVPTWRRTAPAAPASPSAEESRPWLVLGDAGGLGQEVAQRLRAARSAVAHVPARGPTGDGGLPPLDPDREADFDALLAAVEVGWGIPGQVLHLQPLDETSGTDAFCHLLYLARALFRRAWGQTVRLTVVGRGLHEVTGGDMAEPLATSVLGLARVISQEYPNIGCRVIDLPPGGVGSGVTEAEALLAEASSGSDEPVVAYRGGHRWLHGFEPLRLGEAGTELRPWSAPGAHLIITGGLGRFGLAMAEHLARTRDSVALCLVDVSPQRDAGGVDGVSAALSRIRQSGARVWVATVDVADREGMAAVVGEARRRHGRITGVLHAAGHTGMGAYRTLEECGREVGEAHFGPRVRGLRVVADLVAEDEPELCLVASSLAPILGGVGLCALAAADSWADALVHWLRGGGATAWRSIDWEAWEGISPAEGAGLVGVQQSELTITLPEVAAACERIAAAPPTPLVVVATGDLEARIAKWTHVLSVAPAAGAGGARTASSAFRAPHDELEKRIAAIWGAALGVDAVGADDDFFELGGNSLIGLQILSRLRSEFHAELPLRSFFEARTVARMAEFISSRQPAGDERSSRIAAILAEIEELSEEEVEAELGGVPVSGEVEAGSLRQVPAAGGDGAGQDDVSPPVRRMETGRAPMDFSLFFFSADGAADRKGKYRLLLECARFGDRRGFSAVWTPERHFQEFGGLYPNPSVLAAALAVITERIQIRAGSVVLPLHHPVRLAEEWAVVDNLSDGRVAISCASGWHPADFLLAPHQYEDRKEAMYRAVETLRRLWAGQTVRFPAGDGSKEEVRTFPRPLQPELPLWVTSAGSAETWRRAGEIGANLLTSLGNQSLEDLGQKVALYRRAREGAGRDPAAGVVSLMLHTYLGRDDEQVRRLVRQPLAAYLETHMRQRDAYVQLQGITRRDKQELADIAFEHYFANASLLGSPARCSRMVGRLAAVGVDEIACLLDFGLDEETVLAGLELLDELRASHAGNGATRRAGALSPLVDKEEVS